MHIKFVNRSREFEFLDAQRNFIGKKNSVVLVCGKSGVGKSELTKHFIAKNSQNIPSIKVSIQQAEKNIYDAGYYITKLARALHEYAESDSRVYSLTDFLTKRKPNDVVIKKLWEHLKTDLLKWVPLADTTKGLADLLFKEGEFGVNKFFESTHSDVLLTLFEYVKSECSRIPLIINFENIQSIDRRSYELLLLIMKSSNNSLYLLEFTLNDESGYNLNEIISELGENEISFDTLSLSPLSLADVKKIVDDQPEISWDLIKRSSVNWNGNLRSLVDLLTQVKYGVYTDDNENINWNSATSEHLRSLNNNELFVLTIIFVHKEPVQRSLLNKLITYKESLQYVIEIHSLLTNLENHSLINCFKDEIVLSHDTIVQHLIKQEKFELYAIIGQRFWFDTYEELLKFNDVYSSRGWRLMKVLYFGSLLNYDSKIYELLKEINEEALRSRDPLKMIAYVEDVRKKIEQKDKIKYAERLVQINYWLIELYYKIGNSNRAWVILSEMNMYSKKHNILKAILLEQIGSHSEAITFCIDKLNQSDGTNPNYELALNLVKLVTNFDIGNVQITKNEFNRLYKNKKYKSVFEFGFLLRNAELVFSYQDSLPYYKKSIAHFKKHNAVRQAAFSRITYGVHLGLVGEYSAAKHQFYLAENELGDVIGERHSLLNNQAVLLIFQKKTESNADELLRNAMLTAVSDFERLTITMNFMVFMDWKDNQKEVETAISTMLNILKNPTFANKEIIRYSYFNIYKYYKRLENTQLCNYYFEKIKELNLQETPIWKFWLYDEPISKDDEEFHLSVIDRSVSFLCNWNMEYDSSLMHY